VLSRACFNQSRITAMTPVQQPGETLLQARCLSIGLAANYFKHCQLTTQPSINGAYMRKSVIAISALAGALISSVAFAQVKPEDAIKYRQGVYRVMAWNFGSMAAMAKGEKPYDKDAFARNAANVDFVGRLAYEGFTPGSDKGETKAKPEAWSKPDEFKAKFAKLTEETAKLAAISKTGSFDEIKKQLGATGAACKSCHDDFRNK
jgi:cytochrome c556